MIDRLRTRLFDLIAAAGVRLDLASPWNDADDADEERVRALSEALYDDSLEEILGVTDEQLDDVARVVLSSDWLATYAAEAWDEGHYAGQWAPNPYRVGKR